MIVTTQSMAVSAMKWGVNVGRSTASVLQGWTLCEVLLRQTRVGELPDAARVCMFVYIPIEQRELRG